MRKDIRFAHTADWHLGRRHRNLEKRYLDNFRAARRIIRSILQKHEDQPFDFVLHCGDLFEKTKPSPQTLYFTISILAELKEHKIPFYIIRGNHDASPGSLSNNSLHVLDKIGLVKLIDDNTEIIQIRKQLVQIYGLGHRYSNYDSFLTQLISSNPLNLTNINILMLHASIDELSSADGREFLYDFTIGNFEALNFDYIALGHHHRTLIKSLRKGKVVYSGASEHWNVVNWEEDGEWSSEKNWIEVIICQKDQKKTILPKVHRFNVRPKQKKQFDLSNIEPDDAIQKVFEIIKRADDKFPEKQAIVKYSFLLGFNQGDLGNPFFEWEKNISRLLTPACEVEFFDETSEIISNEQKTDDNVIEEIITSRYPDNFEKWKKIVITSLDLASKLEIEENEELLRNQILEGFVVKNVRNS